MSKKSSNGKVLEFDPTKKRKLKSTNYIDPAKKQLKTARKHSQGSKSNKYKSIKYTAFFVILCLIVYILKMSF